MPAHAGIFYLNECSAVPGISFGGKKEIRNKIHNRPFGPLFILFFLHVDCVFLRNWVEFLQFQLLTWVLFIFVVVSCVVHMTFTDAVFVAF